MSEILEDILSISIGTQVHVDLKKDAIEIEYLRTYTEKKNSFFFIKSRNSTRMELRKEWYVTAREFNGKQ